MAVTALGGGGRLLDGEVTELASCRRDKKPKSQRPALAELVVECVARHDVVLPNTAV